MDPKAAAELAQLEERLRQQRETFDQRKRQDQWFFYLRIIVSGVAIVAFIAICAFAGFIVLNTGDFSTGTVAVAASALLVEAIGLVGGILKVIMGNGFKELEPTTPLPASEGASPGS